MTRDELIEDMVTEILDQRIDLPPQYHETRIEHARRVVAVILQLEADAIAAHTP